MNLFGDDSPRPAPSNEEQMRWLLALLHEHLHSCHHADRHPQAQADLVAIIATVLRDNPQSVDKLARIGLSDHDLVLFYIASAILHGIAARGFVDSHGRDCETFVTALFRACLQELEGRKRLPTRYQDYFDAKFRQAAAVHARLGDDPHDEIGNG